MKKGWVRAGAGLVTAALSCAALSQSRPGPTILAAESDSCEAWVTNHTPARRYWVFGYLSGLNTAWGGSYRSPADVLAKIDSEQQVLVWMDNHCKSHPLDSLQKSANQFYRELANR